MEFKTYVLLLCLFVFSAFTALFTCIIVSMVKTQLRIIRGGLDDEDIKKEYSEQNNRKKGNFLGIVEKIVPIVLCTLLSVVFIFSAYTSLFGDGLVKNIPAVKVVASPSMSSKYEKNKYLFDNKLDNQIDTYDLIVLHQLPKEEDLKLYDIVVYEVEGYMLVHRIVGIEEPNEKHPNERHFLLQGDAVQYPDRFPVRYSQMRSIYRGERVPCVGSFVYFMQSPAGILCFILIVFATIALPIIEKKINGARSERYQLILSLATPVAEGSANVPDGATSTDATLAFGTGNRLTFREKLAKLNKERLIWFNQILSALYTIDGLRVSESKRGMTFRKGNKTLAKLSISGKTIVVCTAVEPSEYLEPKYGAKDVSSVKAYATVPTQFKLTSERRVGYVKDVIFDKLGGNRDKYLYTEHFAVQEVATTAVEPENGFDFGGQRKTFVQKLALLDNERMVWFNKLVGAFKTIENVKILLGNRGMTFRKGNKTLTKLTIRGKTIIVCMAVEPSEYLEPKFGAKDVSSVKAYTTVPTQFKLTSERRLGYTMDVVFDKLGGNRDKFKINKEKFIEDLSQTSENNGFNFSGERKTFEQKLALLDSERMAWYSQLISAFKTIEDVKEILGKRGITFRKGNRTLAKLTIRGKTIIVCMAVELSEYSEPKYGIKDVSLVKAFATVPTQFKLTSERRVGYVTDIVYDKFGGVRQKDFGNTYYGRKNYSFKKKLSLLSDERKAWYKELTSFLKQNEKLTRYDSKKGVSFKKGLKPVVKFAIKGKSLYAFIGANPAEFTSAHLGAKDVSLIKAHANYPLQVKITSNRKVKNVKKIIESIW